MAAARMAVQGVDRWGYGQGDKSCTRDLRACRGAKARVLISHRDAVDVGSQRRRTEAVIGCWLRYSTFQMG